jgi:hypothetical protein
VPLAQAVVCAEQVDQPLALLEAADEEDVDGAVAQLLERLRIGESVQVDPVGDDPVVAGEVAADEVSRRPADRDAAVQLVVEAAGEPLPTQYDGEKPPKAWKVAMLTVSTGPGRSARGTARTARGSGGCRTCARRAGRGPAA